MEEMPYATCTSCNNRMVTLPKMSKELIKGNVYYDIENICLLI